MGRELQVFRYVGDGQMEEIINPGDQGTGDEGGNEMGKLNKEKDNLSGLVSVGKGLCRVTQNCELLCS